MGKFSFEFFREKIADLIGPGGITVFRIEKYAHKHDVVITGTFLDFLEDSLKQKNIHIIHLGRETIPGELLQLLSNYPFPGNIPELKSMIYDAVSRHQPGSLSLEVFLEKIREQVS